MRRSALNGYPPDIRRPGIYIINKTQRECKIHFPLRQKNPFTSVFYCTAGYALYNISLHEQVQNQDWQQDCHYKTRKLYYLTAPFTTPFKICFWHTI